MASIALTLGNTVKSYPSLANSKSRKVQRAIKQILERTTNEVLKALRVPERDYNDRTGRLRGGWRKRKLKQKWKWQIGNRTSYASFIEYGTSKIEARRMLHREMYNARARLRRRLSALANRVKRGRLV